MSSLEIRAVSLHQPCAQCPEYVTSGKVDLVCQAVKCLKMKSGCELWTGTAHSFKKRAPPPHLAQHQPHNHPGEGHSLSFLPPASILEALLNSGARNGGLLSSIHSGEEKEGQMTETIVGLVSYNSY